MNEHYNNVVSDLKKEESDFLSYLEDSIKGMMDSTNKMITSRNNASLVSRKPHFEKFINDIVGITKEVDRAGRK